jgi:hypothetical protein
MEELLGRTDIERGGFLGMERTVRFITAACSLQRNVRTDEVDNIRRRQHLFNRLFGN